MSRILMILEVSQKQNYIFASRLLKINAQRSVEIAKVTDSDYFSQICPGEYDPEQNLVYSGGGHTVLQFSDKDRADRFARKLTRQVLKEFPGMDLFVRQMAYDEALTPGENLNRLSRLLEEKKALRSQMFRTHAMGIEAAGSITSTGTLSPPFRVPKGWRRTEQMDIADKDDNFLAVVHIDGNAMGSRVQAIYEACRNSWPECCRLLKLFSTQIDQHYREAFDEMAQDLANELDRTKAVQRRREAGKTCQLPLRKIIGAGDDVCFITTGRQGLECAASFLRHLSAKRNQADDQFYTACAGVVLYHKKFPFRQAYDLSEDLCRNAKQFCSEYDGGISALDFHVEYGQMKDTLAEIRADYVSDDGARLELRPLAVTGGSQIPEERLYQFHRKLLWRLSGDLKKQDGTGLIARSKLKSLRTYLRQGQIETEYAIKKTQSAALLQLNKERGPFFTDKKGVRRCLYFDAIELLDVATVWQEEKP